MMKGKRWVWLGILSLLVAFSAAGQLSKSSLPGAVSAGKVTVQLRGLGGSSGDALRMDVAKTSKAGSGSLELEVPPGLKVTSPNEAIQGMVIAGVRGRLVNEKQFVPQKDPWKITVASTKPVPFLLEAYCADFGKDNPTKSTTFKLGPWDNTLSRILKEARSRKLSVRATQAAVWIYTDHVTWEELSEKFPVSEADWEAAQAVVQRCQN